MSSATRLSTVPTGRGRRFINRRPALAAAVAAVAALCSSTAHAVDTTWVGGSDDWFTAANWNTGNVPTGADATRINNGATVSVSGGNAVSQQLWLGQGTGATGYLVLTGGTVATQGAAGAGEFRVGTEGGSGAVTHSAGTLSPNTNFHVGFGVGSVGSYLFTGGSIALGSGGIAPIGNGGGFGTFLQTGGTFDAGSGGTGTLSIGRVTGATSAGTGIYTLVDGSVTTRDLLVGGLPGAFTGGNGTFNQLGGTVSVSGNTLLNRSVNATAAFNLAGGTFSTNTFNMARLTGTTGTLHVSGGTFGVTGQFTTGSESGTVTGGNAAISLSGGTMNVGGNFNLAFGGGTATVATFNVSGGQLNLSAPGVIFAVGNGAGTTATVTQTGGVVSATGATSTLSIGRGGANGTYNLQGGLLRISTVSTNSATGTKAFNFTGGTLAASTVAVTLSNNGGTLAPGLDGVGTTLITTGTGFANNTYTQTSAGVLAIDLASSSSYDRLVGSAASGTVTLNLNGAITVNPLPGYTPAVGDAFDVITSRSLIDNGIAVADTSSRPVTFTKSVIQNPGPEFIVRLTTTDVNRWQAPAAGDADWSNPLAWTAGAGPNAVGAKAYFGAGSPAFASVTGNFIAGNLTFDAPSGFSFFPAGGATVTMQMPGGAHAVIHALGGGSSTLSPDLVLASSLDVNVDAASLLDMDGVISGPGGLTKTGAGELGIFAPNTYAGPTTVADGTLFAGGNNALPGTTALTVAAGATLGTGTTNQTVASLSGEGTVLMGRPSAVSRGLTVSGAVSTTFSGLLVGSGHLVKGGAGTLTLAGTDLRSGHDATTVAAGTLVVRETAALSGDVTNDAVLVIHNDADGAFDGRIDGSGHLVKAGVGVLALASGNAYFGNTSVTAGTLAIDSVDALGAPFATNSISIDNATLRVTDLAGFAGFGNSRTFVLGAGGATIQTDSATRIEGPVTGPGSLTKTGAATLTLFSGTPNSYAGATNVHQGVLLAGQPGAIPAGSAVRVLSGATLDLAGFAASFGNLEGGGAVVNAADLTVGSNNSSGIFTGSLAGTGAFVKTGTGTLTLLGTSTYVGNTTVAAGTLAGTPATLRGPIQNNGTVAFTMTTDGTFAGSVAGPGNFVKDGDTSTLTITAPLQYNGNTTIAGGTLVLRPDTYLGLPTAGSTYTLRGQSTLKLTGPGSYAFPAPLVPTSTGGRVDTDAGANALFTAGINGSAALTKLGAGTLNTTNLRVTNLTLSAGTLAVLPTTFNPAATATANVVTSLSVAGANTTLADGRTNFLATATLDLNDNDLVIDHAATAAAGVLDSVRQLVTTGARGASGADADLLWSGPGITSTTARERALHFTPGPVTAIGYSDAALFTTRTGQTSFAGYSLDGSAVLLRYTYAGDATLDGLVTDADVDALVANYGPATGKLWSDADFTYDGVVNDRDLDLLASTFGVAHPSLAITEAGFARLAALRGAAVPEPTAALLLPAVVGLAMTRRRRTTK